MYYMGSIEFQQYMVAQDKLDELKKIHSLEIKCLYDDIHPTRTGFNYDMGRTYSESVNVAEYAIWIIETKEQQKRQQEWWEKRAKAFSVALSRLTEEERAIYQKLYNGLPAVNEELTGRVLNKIKDELERFISLIVRIFKKET